MENKKRNKKFDKSHKLYCWLLHPTVVEDIS